MLIHYEYEHLIYDHLEQDTVSHNVNKNILLHSHEMYEIYLNAGDVICYMADGYMYELPRGGIILIPPGIEHYAYNNVGDSYHRIRIHLSEKVLRDFSGYQTNLMSLFQNPCVRTLPADGGEKYRRNMEQEAKNDRNGYLPVLLCVIEMLIHIRQTEQNLPILQQGKHIPAVLADILRYISSDNAFIRIQTNREIAQKFYITESYLSRLFKQYMPMSLHRYLCGLKMAYAREMLSRGKSVTDVCFEVGYSDCSHFISVYKEFYGETPGKTKTVL